MNLKDVMKQAAHLNPFSGITGEHEQRRKILSEATGQEWKVEVLNVREGAQWRMGGFASAFLAESSNKEKGQRMAVYTLDVPKDVNGNAIAGALNEALDDNFLKSRDHKEIFTARSPLHKGHYIIAYDNKLSTIADKMKTVNTKEIRSKIAPMFEGKPKQPEVAPEI